MLPVHLRSSTMAAQIRLLVSLCLASVLLTVAFANPITIDATAIESVAKEPVSVNINRLFDSILPDIRNFILKRGLDPMPLEDISINLKGLIYQRRMLNLTNGWLQGLSTMERTQDVILSYDNKALTLDAALAIDVASASYEYLFKGAVITRRGDAHGNIKNMEVRVVVTVDMKYYKIVLSKLEIIRFDKLEVKLQGNVLDPVLNAALKPITKLFRTRITCAVEQRTSIIVQKFLDKINQKIPRPDVKEGNNIFNYLPASYELPALAEVK